MTAPAHTPPPPRPPAPRAAHPLGNLDTYIGTRTHHYIRIESHTHTVSDCDDDSTTTTNKKYYVAIRRQLHVPTNRYHGYFRFNPF